jgi:hypothetical protein
MNLRSAHALHPALQREVHITRKVTQADDEQDV